MLVMTAFSLIDQADKNKEEQSLKNLMNTLNTIEIYIGFYILQKICVVLWLCSLTALNHMSDHKENFNKFQKGEVLEAIFFASNPIKLEPSYKALY